MFKPTNEEATFAADVISFARRTFDHAPSKRGLALGCAGLLLRAAEMAQVDPLEVLSYARDIIDRYRKAMLDA